MFFVLVLLASLLRTVHGLRNVTVDDSDTSSIVYIGNWGQPPGSPLDYGGAHHLSSDSSATASLTFTGVGVYFMSPLWPYLVNTRITLDSGVPYDLDLVDHTPGVGGAEETVQSQVVWGLGGLANTQHTVVASIVPGGPFVVVDAFIYTVLDPSDMSSSSTSSTSVSSSSSSVGSTTSRAVAPPATSSAVPTPPSPNRKLAIALGGVFGAVGIAVIVAAFLLCRRHHTPSTPGSTPWTLDSTVYPGPAVPPQNQMAAAHSSPVNSAYFGQQYPGTNQPYAGATQGFDPTNSPHAYNAPWPSSYYDHPTMAAAAAPAPLFNQYAETNPNVYPNGVQQPMYDHWQAATPRSPNPSAGRGPYQVNTLSTITESSSVGQYGITATPRPGSEFGYQGPSEGSDRMSSVGSGSRPTSSYLPSQQYGGQKERELVSSKSQEFSPVPGSSDNKVPGQPPEYLP